VKIDKQLTDLFCYDYEEQDEAKPESTSDLQPMQKNTLDEKSISSSSAHQFN